MSLLTQRRVSEIRAVHKQVKKPGYRTDTKIEPSGGAYEFVRAFIFSTVSFARIKAAFRQSGFSFHIVAA
jgi:hypothetical protein